MAGLSVEEIRKIKETQDDADRQKLATATPEGLKQAWEDRMKLYQQLWPNTPRPGTQKWKTWRCVQTKKCPSGQ